MPPKNKNKVKRPKAKKPVKNELAQITTMLKNMNKPASQVTDLGRMLLAGGNTVGSMFGFPKVFGSGAYALESNSLWNASQQVPIMHSSNESIRFRHREYIGDVAMNGNTFTSSQYSVNPGLFQTFPFLSSIASNFQEYSFKGLVFEFKTTSATSLVSGTNTAMGSVMLAAQYRSDAPAFTSKAQLLNEMWSVDTVPSSDAILPIECAPGESPMSNQYVRTGNLTSGDVKLYDLCTVTYATAGGQTGQTNVIGELWVSYDIELRKPQVSVISNQLLTPAATFTGTNLWSNSQPFIGWTIGNNNLNVMLSPNSIIWESGNLGYYAVYCRWGTSTTASITNPTFSGSGLDVANIFNTLFSPPSGISSDNISFFAIVNVTSTGPASLTISGMSLPATPTSGVLIISQVASNPALFGV